MDVYELLELAIDDDSDEAWAAIFLTITFDEIINDDDDRVNPVIFDRIVIHPGGAAEATQIAEGLLAGSDIEFEETFRLSKRTFNSLACWLRRHGIDDTRYQTVEHKLLIVLYILAFGEPQRNAAHRFKVSQSAVSRSFHTIINALVCLHKEVVVLPSESYVSPDIELNAKNAVFNGCIGAVDGTLIPAHIPASQQRRFFDRKGNISQNVFTAVKFDYTFSYVLAGAEGSMNDKTLLNHALARSFTAGAGQFYLADAGFGESNAGIVTPFVGQRYHLRDYLESNMRPQSRKELYNLAHARLRSVVERVFGLVKRKFKIVRGKNAAEYNFATQRFSREPEIGRYYG
ncbi:hypothetical protein CKAH01_01460 [Colletotrichum kahawae]|uniref:DDE Tnp4 domain-containing protein n=1 Tax=Colletotrichum kahawae TaxID=34407 RepID=A0AAD9Y847_COLKA|nr:hypothetical protein CKAH01_01460 [Colletotrichum kahawae]